MKLAVPLLFVAFVGSLSAATISERQIFGSIFGGSNNGRDRPQFQSLEAIENLIKALYDGLVGNFLKALGKINGLTTEQIAQLENEFRNGLDQFPRPPLSEFYNPLKWINWAKKVTDHAFSLSQKLLHQARLLADNILSKLPQEEYQKRQLFGSRLSIEQRIKNLYDDLTTSFLRSLRRIRGLTESQIAQLEQDFRNGMNSMPKPPLSLATIWNPFEWLKFSADASKHALHLTGILLQEARDLVANLVNQGKDELENLGDKIGDAAGSIEKELGDILKDFEKNIDKEINKQRS